MWYVYYEVLVEGRIETESDVYEWEEWEMEHFLHYSKEAVARCAVWYAKRAMAGKTRNLMVQEYVSEY